LLQKAKGLLKGSSKTTNLCIDMADILFFYTNFVVRIQNSGAVATLLRGQRAGGGVESAIKIIACHSLSPSFSAMKTQKLAPSPCLPTKVKVA
jgi:hypothetical protein